MEESRHRTTPFLRKVAANLLDRFGSDLKDIAVVLPNKRPVVFLRKHLAELSGRPLWSPPFFTVQEFFAQATPLAPASLITQFFVLYRQHNMLLRHEGRSEESPDEFYPLAETILADYAQLDYELVNPDVVYAELHDIALLQQRFPQLSEDQQRFMQQFWESFSVGKQTAVQEKFLHLWGRLPKLYRHFKEELKIKGLTTTASIYRELAEGQALHADFIQNYREVAFVGFNALNRCEANLFAQWQEAGKAIFYYDADAYYFEDHTQEAGMFLRRNVREYGLHNALGGFSNVLGLRDNKIEVIAASGNVAQAKLLSEKLQLPPAVANDHPQRAVILADESLLIPVLQSLPDAINFNITMGYPLTQSSLFGLIDLWLSVQQHLAATGSQSVHHSTVEAVIAHPLAGISADERRALQEAIQKEGWLDVPVSELQLHTGCLPNFFIPRKGNVALLSALDDFLDHVLQWRQEHRALRHLEASLIIASKKTLNQLADGLTEYPELATTFICLLIRKALQSVSAPIEGEPLSGVQIMGLLESRCLDFDEVYILGCNEGSLPKITAGSTFIPDSIRRAHGLPVLENQDALSAYLFYRLLHTPQRITLVYNQVIDDGSGGEMSRFIRQLAFESRFSFHVLSQQQPIKALPPASSLSVAKTGKVWKKLARYLDASDANRPKLSASAFTTYLQSPVLFFLKYIADIKEPPRVAEEFELNRLGSVVHRAMQHVYERLAREGAQIESKDIRGVLPTVPDICLRALSEEMYGAPDKINSPNSMQRILLKIAIEYTVLFLTHDADQVAPFRIIELENGEDYSLDFEITVNGKEYTVRLYGIIDRVDEVAGKTRIVDYKTGRDEVKFHSEEVLFAPLSEKSNKAMIQTLFYTFIYEQISGRRGVEPNLYVARRVRQEGTRFYRSGRGRITMEDDLLENLKKNFVSFLRRTLEELFDPTVPFIDNQLAPLYPEDPYMEFIGQVVVIDEDD